MSELVFIESEDEGQRLDVILAKKFPNSRSYFQKLIEQNLVLLNGEPVKKRIKPQIGDELEVEFQLDTTPSLQAEDIPLTILFEDEDILVVNKPSQMVVHPAVGNWSGTLVNALLWRYQTLPNDAKGVRPGIVHRLDKETSGVLIVAKTPLAHQALVSAFATRKVKKTYYAITYGFPNKGVIETYIGRDPKERQKMAVVSTGGKLAITEFETVQRDGLLSLVKVNLLTGRTHQIRVHMAHLGCPILGDSVYGLAKINRKYNIQRHLLHAYRLELMHPKFSNMLQFVAPLPQEFPLRE